VSSVPPNVVGAGLLSAPATLPEQRPLTRERDVDAELVDLLCEDQNWLDTTFREIVAASWSDPPRGGPARQAARPRRFGAPRRRAPRRVGGGRSQWSPRPRGRQRSPPRA
jgi:hypothetical protein